MKSKSFLGGMDESLTAYSNMMEQFERTTRITSQIMEPYKLAVQQFQMANLIDMEPYHQCMEMLASTGISRWVAERPSWQMETTAFSKLQSNNVFDLGLAPLLEMEQRTSSILGSLYDAQAKMTSVSTQINTIYSSYMDMAEALRNIIVPPMYVQDLYSLADRQHLAIQRCTDSLEWRMDIIDAASKFVDRQVTWAEEHIAQVSEDDWVEVEVIEDEDEWQSPVALLPQYLGYTNRENVDVTVEEALANSTLVIITEKGKQIIEKTDTINALCRACGCNEIFSITHKFCVNASRISATVCSSRDILGNIIDCFYMVFYENLEHIKKIVADETVRKDDVYQCIFRIKDIRTDFRHDIEHGGAIKYAKKRQQIEGAYRHYTNRTTATSQKECTKLQLAIYDDFLKLENHLIALLNDKIDAMTA